jgi:hypothetical protein
VNAYNTSFLSSAKEEGLYIGSSQLYWETTVLSNLHIAATGEKSGVGYELGRANLHWRDASYTQVWMRTHSPELPVGEPGLVMGWNISF